MNYASNEQTVCAPEPELEVVINRLGLILDSVLGCEREIGNFLARWDPAPEANNAKDGPVPVPSGVYGRLADAIDKIDRAANRALGGANQLSRIA
jgi:hypothetical protein